MKTNKETTKVGDYNVNSRITIDYTKPEPEVTFEYPSKKSGPNNIAMLFALGMMFLTFGVIQYLFTGGIVLESIVYGENDTLNIAYTYSNRLSSGEYIQNYRLGSVEGISAMWYPVLDLRLTQQKELLVNIFGFLGVLIICFAMYYYIFKLILNKTMWGKKIFPELNKKLSNKRFTKTFTECPDSLQIELPLFKNIYLDYETSRDFSDQLIRFEIKEHDCEYYKSYSKNPKKVKKDKNVYLWKAVWYFKKKPITGFLKVDFT